jgi:hypothetical protein
MKWPLRGRLNVQKLQQRSTVGALISRSADQQISRTMLGPTIAWSALPLLYADCAHSLCYGALAKVTLGHIYSLF